MQFSCNSVFRCTLRGGKIVNVLLALTFLPCLKDKLPRERCVRTRRPMLEPFSIEDMSRTGRVRPTHPSPTCHCMCHPSPTCHCMCHPFPTCHCMFHPSPACHCMCHSFPTCVTAHVTHSPLVSLHVPPIPHLCHCTCHPSPACHCTCHPCPQVSVSPDSGRHSALSLQQLAADIMP